MIPLLIWASVRAPDKPGVRLEVSISARRLSVMQNGEVVKTYAVAVGRQRLARTIQKAGGSVPLLIKD